MIVSDNTGLAMTATSARTSADYDEAMMELALWRNPIKIIDRAPDSDPAFAMGHIFKTHMDLASTDRRYADLATQRIADIQACFDKFGASDFEYLLTLI